LSARKFLKPNVLVEPLVNRWHAWSYIISPATAAMYTTGSHYQMLRSFAANPRIHINALKNPEMAGGPYIDLGLDRVDEIKQLLEWTRTEQAHLFELSDAVKALHQLLASEARGGSLEPLYAKVPEPLRGYVELVYDLDNQATIRFLEGLLYHSPYYRESSQSLAFSLIEKDTRSYVLSTPRLLDEHTLHKVIPFRDEALDLFFGARYEPRDPDELAEALAIGPDQRALFDSFFTTTAPPAPNTYRGEGVRCRYFGHACVLVESDAVNLLFDPVLTHEHHSDMSRYTMEDLPDHIDYVFITHNHGDHCKLETLLPLRGRIGQIIVPKSCGGGLQDPSLKMMFEAIGFPSVRELDEMERLEIADGAVTGLPFFGEHGDLNIRSKMGFHVSLKGRSLMLVADSNNFEPQLYEHFNRIFGSVDALFLGMECDGAPLSWPYGPLLPKPLPRKLDQARRIDGSNFEKGFDLVKLTDSRRVFIYAMGQEPWLIHLTSVPYSETSRPHLESEKLIQACIDTGIPAERLCGCKEFFL